MANLFDSVVLAPIAIGGTHLDQWVPDGPFHRRFLVAIEKLARQGLEITHVLWQQGEADRLIGNPAMYRRVFEDIWLSLRQYGVYAPIYVARSSYCGSANTVVETAQTEVVDLSRRIYAGADTDTLPAEFRYDGCHLNGKGADRQAKLWLEALAAPRFNAAQQEPPK